MIALEFEQALRQLEESTNALLSTESSDLMALHQALDDRATAITKVALIAQQREPSDGSSAALERLAVVLVRGEEAARRLLASRLEAASQLARVRRTQQTLEPPAESRSSSLDYQA